MAMPAHLVSPQATPYGPSEQGLICAWRFDGDGVAEPLATLDDALRALDAADGFVWIHLNLSSAGSERWMREHAALGDAFFDALREGSRATRIERDGDALFAVINDVTFDFGFDAGDPATLWLVVRERLAISARRHPLRAVDRLRTAVKRGDRLRSSVELLDHLLREQADELQRIVRTATDKIDDIGDAILAGHHERHGAELARLRRLLVRLQRLLAPEPSAMTRTLAHPPRWTRTADVQRLAQAGEEFALVLRDIAALQERAKLMQDEAAARIAEENSRSLYTLTMVTVLALPIHITAGLFGMNVGGVPLADSRGGFWIMLALIAALTAPMAWLVLGRRRSRQRR